MQYCIISIIANGLCRKIERIHQLFPLILGDICATIHETTVNKHDGWLLCYHGKTFKRVFQVDLHPYQGLLEANALIKIVTCYFLDIDATIDHGGGSLRNYKDVVAFISKGNSDA